jgi:hypothetical protein
MKAIDVFELSLLFLAYSFHSANQSIGRLPQTYVAYSPFLILLLSLNLQLLWTWNLYLINTML